MNLTAEIEAPSRFKNVEELAIEFLENQGIEPLVLESTPNLKFAGYDDLGFVKALYERSAYFQMLRLTLFPKEDYNTEILQIQNSLEFDHTLVYYLCNDPNILISRFIELPKQREYKNGYSSFLENANEFAWDLYEEAKFKRLCPHFAPVMEYELHLKKKELRKIIEYCID
jgi:hypothetical protein